jgi:hypothetical protein
MHHHPTRQVRIRVTGRVQGVGFRYSTRSVGESLWTSPPGISTMARC